MIFKIFVIGAAIVIVDSIALAVIGFIGFTKERNRIYGMDI